MTVKRRIAKRPTVEYWTTIWMTMAIRKKRIPKRPTVEY
jgi:hypothetical protein